MAALELRQTVQTGVELRFGMRPAPSLVAYATLLALAAHDLEQVVDRELELNPALERVEPERCTRCGGLLLASGCPACSRLRLSEDRKAPRRVPVEAIEEAVNPLTDLRRDLGTVLSATELPLAEHVLASLDERGFLREGAQGVAAWLGVETTRVEQVVGAIRAVGPPGICASDARECLRLQLVSRPGLVATHPILP
ncbi:MAG TPA: hypothetical protein VNH40_03850, partial [Gaiellaceae bacterium]|nr:hypothetical protein [Gaiellaceae bacterium]